MSIVVLASATQVQPARASEPTQKVRIIGFNDFHGQLSTTYELHGHRVGSAPVFISYLKESAKSAAGASLFVHAGDMIGASAPESALAQDEPAVALLNLLAGESCRTRGAMSPACNLVGAVGNHELDEGIDELLRLQNGGIHARGPFLAKSWQGADFSYLAANLQWKSSHLPVFAPFTIRRVGRVQVAIIGAVLRDANEIVAGKGIEQLDFLDEAEQINAWVGFLQMFGIHTFVVAIHQGLEQNSYEGDTDANATQFSEASALESIVQRLDADVDVVVSGHAHAFTNALMRGREGSEILVTQAYSGGKAFAEIDLEVDVRTGDVISKRARIIETRHDQGAGLQPDAQAQQIVRAAIERVAPQLARPIGELSRAYLRRSTPAGESSLGSLLADAARVQMATDFAVTNPGGIRDDLAAGQVTWGDLLRIQPFGNQMVVVEISGSQLRALLEAQWLGQERPRILQISGFEYTWNPHAPLGSRVTQIRSGGQVLQPQRIYRMAVNGYLAAGGDRFHGFRHLPQHPSTQTDLEILVAYLASPHFRSDLQPVSPRIVRVP